MKRYWISSLFFLFVSAGLFFCLNWLDQSLARKELQTKFTQKQIIMDNVGKPDVEDVDLVIAIDNSGSMRDAPGTDKNNLRLRAAELIVSSLAADIYPRSTSIALETFGEGVDWLHDLVKLSDDGARKTLINLIQSPEYSGLTQISLALDRAFEELFESERRNPENIPALILITDGEPVPNEYPNDLKGIREQISKFTEANSEVRLFIILLRDPDVERGRPELTEWAENWFRLSQEFPQLRYFEPTRADQLEAVYNEIRNRLDDKGMEGMRITYDPSDSKSSIFVPLDLRKFVLTIRRPTPNVQIELFDPEGNLLDMNPLDAGADSDKIFITNILGSYFKVYTLGSPASGNWTLSTSDNTPVDYMLNPESIYDVQVLLPQEETYLITNQPMTLYASVINSETGIEADEIFKLHGSLSFEVDPSKNLLGVEKIDLPPFKYDLEQKNYFIEIESGTIPFTGEYELEIIGESESGRLVNSVHLMIDAIEAPGMATLSSPRLVECDSVGIAREGRSVSDILFHPQLDCFASLPIEMTIADIQELDSSQFEATISDVNKTKLDFVSPGRFQGIVDLRRSGNYTIQGQIIGKTKSGHFFTRNADTSFEVTFPASLKNLRERIFQGAVLSLILALWKPLIVLILSFLFYPLKLVPIGRFKRFQSDEPQEIQPDGIFRGRSISEVARKNRTLFGVNPDRSSGGSGDFRMTGPNYKRPLTGKQPFFAKLGISRWLTADPNQDPVCSIRVAPFRGVSFCKGRETYYADTDHPLEQQDGNFTVQVASGEPNAWFWRLFRSNQNRTNHFRDGF